MSGIAGLLRFDGQEASRHELERVANALRDSGVPLIADQAANIGAQLGEAYSRFVERLGQSSNLLLRRLAEVIPPQFGLPADVSAAPVEGQGVEVVESPFAQVWVTLGTVAGGIYKTAAIFFVAFFWTVESDRIKRVGISLLPLNRRDPARDLITEIEGRVGGYVAGQVVVSGIIGTLSLIAYWIIGIPYAIVLALIIALMEFIPVVGPLIGAVPSIIIALSIAPSKAVWVLIVSLVIHQLEANVFGPRVMKRTLGMRPLVTLVAMTAFGTLFGMLGLNKLPRHHHPVFESDRFDAATDDKFFISIEAGDEKFDLEKTRSLLESTHPSHLELVEEEVA